MTLSASGVRGLSYCLESSDSVSRESVDSLGWNQETPVLLESRDPSRRVTIFQYLMESNDPPYRNHWIPFLLESYEPPTRVSGFSQVESEDSGFARIARPLHESHPIPIYNGVRRLPYRNYWILFLLESCDPRKRVDVFCFDFPVSLARKITGSLFFFSFSLESLANFLIF